MVLSFSHKIEIMLRREPFILPFSLLTFECFLILRLYVGVLMASWAIIAKKLFFFWKELLRNFMSWGVKNKLKGFSYSIISIVWLQSVTHHAVKKNKLCGVIGPVASRFYFPGCCIWILVLPNTYIGPKKTISQVAKNCGRGLIER